jgi:hypothetical protein
MNPKPSYYNEFNGYTLGLLFALIFIAVFWASGLYVIAPRSLRSMTEEEVKARKAKFSSTCLQRTLILLYLVYPGVSVAIFGMFSCTTVGTVSYLDQDVSITCFNTTWWRYVGGAIVWVFLVPVGVPVFFNRLLRHFKVPDLAALLEDNAWLREAAEHTWRLGMPQPAVDMQRLCCDAIDDNHLAMLHAVLVQGADANTAATILAGQKPKAETQHAALPDVEGKAGDKPAGAVASALSRVAQLRQTIAAKLRPELQTKPRTSKSMAPTDRETQLAQLMTWCRHGGILSIAPISWTDDLGLPEPPSDGAPDLYPPHRTGLRSHQVPFLLQRASVECGFLFAVYTTKCWYWESVELVRKLILTSILALISPGSAGQVVVGCMVAFFALLGNIKLKPYSERSLNFVNQIAQLNLFFFLFVGILLKVQIDGAPSDSMFFSGLVGGMSIVPVALPIGIKVFMRLASSGKEESQEMRDVLDRADEDN